jgi:AcrR family transcriptional regulator
VNGLQSVCYDASNVAHIRTSVRLCHPRGVSVTFDTHMHELPVVQAIPEPPERADAARNREKVLAAAERLFAERGADCVSMDAVAIEAGVGKGTVFRRFGDRAGLAQAILGERERRFQEEFIRGPAPLGPGAPPEERLIAFGARLLEHYGQFGELIAMAEEGQARYRSGPFVFYRMHVAMLVREADPDCDAEYLADAMLAALSAKHLQYLRRVREVPDEQIAAGWADLVRRLLTPR